MKPHDPTRITVSLGEDIATIRREGVSSVTCATILGRECSTDGTERVYLDRLVHRIGEDQFSDWQVSGAISTVLARKAVAESNPNLPLDDIPA